MPIDECPLIGLVKSYRPGKRTNVYVVSLHKPVVDCVFPFLDFFQVSTFNQFCHRSIIMGNIGSATACLGCGHGNSSPLWKSTDCELENQAFENCRTCKINLSSNTTARELSGSKSWYRSHRVMLESQRANIENLIEKASTERTAAMVSESFMLQNLSVIESQKAKLDQLFRRSADYSDNRRQHAVTGPEATSCGCPPPPFKTVSFSGFVDEHLFDGGNPWPSDDEDEDNYGFECNDSSTASDSSDEDEDLEDMLCGEDLQVNHTPRWPPVSIGASCAQSPSTSPSLSPIARLMDAAAAKFPAAGSSRTVPLRCADAR
jgi:hypothetical protein